MDTETIVLGSTVVVEEEATHRKTTVTLVDEGKANVSAGLLSVKSPLGSALVGSRAGDHLVVNAPAGALKYTIHAVQAPR